MLQRLQNLCFKNIQVDRLTPTIQIHDELNMDMLSLRRKKHSAIEMYKVENQLVPETVGKLFAKPVHEHQT